MLFFAHVVYSVIAKIKNWEYCHKITITKKLNLTFKDLRISGNLEGKMQKQIASTRMTAYLISPALTSKQLQHDFVNKIALCKEKKL